MRSLRTQLLLSHLVLVGIMAVVMAVAAVNFLRLGRSIDRILKDNYKSVVAAQNMKEALERQDSAATFFLAGQTEKARQQYRTNRTRFEEAYQIEVGNITEPGEQQIADDIGILSARYRRDIERLLYADQGRAALAARAFYFGTLEPQFLALKQRAQDVLELNQAAIVRADQRAKSEAEQAMWMSLATTASALALAVLLALRLTHRALTPLVSLTRQAKEIGAGRLNQAVELRQGDEVGTLARSFNEMAEKLRAARAALEERLSRAEGMSAAALESLYDPVVVTDARGQVIHLNRAAEGLFGPEACAAGRAVAQVVGDARVAHAIERAIRHEHVSAEENEAAFVPLKAGENARTYRLRATPMTASAAAGEEGASREIVLGAVAVLEDITSLREVDRLKTEFIGVAAHELRTPVTSLLLSVQLLQEGAIGDLTPAQREVLAVQREDLERLERMMRDLLDLTRLEAGATPPRFEVVSPSQLTQAAQAAVEMAAAAKSVRLIEDVPPDLPLVRADQGQITRVLVNLLNNAVRHTPPSGSVQLSARRAQGNRGVAFAVSDTGTGIPPEYLSHIFERFAQVPGATKGGAGLGLSIAKTIVEAHGGTVAAQSGGQNQGATFTFILPTAAGAGTTRQE